MQVCLNTLRHAAQVELIIVFVPPTTGVTDLEREPSGEGRATKYALLVADTVVVAAGGAQPELVTALANKGWNDAAYYFKARL